MLQIKPDGLALLSPPPVEWMDYEDGGSEQEAREARVLCFFFFFRFGDERDWAGRRPARWRRIRQVGCSLNVSLTRGVRYVLG